MKRIGLVSTVLMSFLLFGASAFSYAQNDKHEDKGEKSEKQDKPNGQNGKQNQRRTLAKDRARITGRRSRKASSWT